MILFLVLIYIWVSSKPNTTDKYVASLKPLNHWGIENLAQYVQWEQFKMGYFVQ